MLGRRFDTPDRSFVFTGDTGPSDAVTKLAEGADVLVTEVGEIESMMKSFYQFDAEGPGGRLL